MTTETTAAVATPDTRNIHQRINAVMRKIGGVAPDKLIGEKGKSWSYEVVTYNAIVAKVRHLFVEHGILVVTRQVGPGRMVGTNTFSMKEVENMRYEAMYEIDFVNIDDPTDKITEAFESHAIDGGDKAPGKTATYSTKAAIKKILMLSNEADEDEEERNEDTSGTGTKAATKGNGQAPIEKTTAKAPAADSNSPKIPAGQVKFLERKLGEKKVDAAKLLAHLQVATLADVTVDQFAPAQAFIKAA